MSAANSTSFLHTATWGSADFTLTSGTKAYQYALAVIDPATGKVKPAVGSDPTLKIVGQFTETVDATSAEQPVTVKFFNLKTLVLLANSAAGAAITLRGSTAYIADDQTATNVLTVSQGVTNAALGTVWGFQDGLVAVEVA